MLLLIAIAAVGLVMVQLVVPALGGRVVAVAGGSMEPAIPLGALLIEMPVTGGQLRLGDVVTLITGTDQLVTHRIVRLASLADVPYIETKGDANDNPDPVITPQASVVGREVVAIPVAGRVALALRHPIGRVAVASIAGALWLAAGLLRSVARPRDGIASIGDPESRLVTDAR